MKSLYQDFVAKVGEARNKDVRDIEEIAQGRVWSGIKAKEIGLVDTIGSIETAIMIAKEKAGIPEDEDITIVELPKAQFFPPDLFQPKIIDTKAECGELIRYLQFLSEENGNSLVIIPLEDLVFLKKHYLK